MGGCALFQEGSDLLLVLTRSSDIVIQHGGCLHPEKAKFSAFDGSIECCGYAEAKDHPCILGIDDPVIP